MSLRRDSRGDTLVEVTVALAILSLVLLSSTRLAIRAFQQGQTARERTTVALVAQNQLEYLRNFRDNHSWSEFTTGNGATYTGVLNTSALSGCRGAGPDRCFHMIKTGDGYVPVVGSVTPDVITVPDSYVEIVATPDNPGSPETVNFQVYWGFRDLSGGPTNVNHVATQLTRLVATTPAPVPPVCVNNSDIVFVLDSSESMKWDWNGPDWNYQAYNRMQIMIDLLVGAGGFLNNVGIGSGNQGAIIAFNDTNPVVKQSLTTNVPNLMATVDNQSDFTTTTETRYKPALQRAWTVLNSGAARPGADKIVVFISDGFPDDYREVDPTSGYWNQPENEAYLKNFIDNNIVPPYTTMKVYTVGIQAGVPDNPVLHYLADQTTGAAGNYHAVLTPADFGTTLNALADLLDC